MCGLAGIVGPDADSDESRRVLARMLEALVHRGPDDEGTATGKGFAVGARRLSILDVAHGHQPMASEGGDVVVSLNGEIYDHEALRRDLVARGHRFRTRSDTEVVLRLYQDEGAACLDRLEGMFALSVWDARERTLLLARDRLGEKPLLWFERGGLLVYASEWRALSRHPDSPRDVDPEAVALFLLHRFVPSPLTAVGGVRRLEPGHLLRWRGGRAATSAYWTLPTPGPSPAGSRADAAAEVLRLLDHAVESRLAADVPVGVFLSGGIDSAAVVALAARRGPVATFTLRPGDAEFDEGEGARRTAAAVGAEHHEIAVDPAEIAAGFEEVFARIDEPIGDSSLVPTLLLARGARRRVKVVLGGEGADELFGGYPTYLGARAARAVRWMPRPVRLFLARRLGGGGHNVGTGWLLRRLLEGADLAPLERHLLWFGAFPAAEQVLLWRPEARPGNVGDDLLSVARAAARPADATGDPVDALLRVGLLLHLPDALLAKVDRATMLESLEARAPYLERRLVEAAAAMPARWKVGRLSTKIVLREALASVVPPEVLKRKKRGFAVPVARAFLGPLGDRLRERVRSSELSRRFFEPGHVLGLLEAHRQGRADHARRLYTLLALLEWGERWVGKP